MMRTVACDLDGTLADIRHRVRWAQTQDWDRFHKEARHDPVIEPVARLIRSLERDDWQIILMTGRSESMREATVNWLLLANVPYDQLRMRPEGNTDHDADLKLRWAQDYMSLQLVLEDRDKVVAAWRAAGYLCLQTAPGAY